jgi:hypothetical protein
VRDGLEESGDSVISYATALTFVTNWLAPGIAASALSGIASFLGYLIGKSKSETQTQLNDALDDLAGWNDALCQLVPLMSPVVTFANLKGTRATEADYLAFVDVIQDNVPIGSHVLQILNTYPMSSILTKVREKLDTQECECEQYLPYGYVPVTAGGISMRAYGIPGGTTQTAYNKNTSDALPIMGTKTAPGIFRSGDVSLTGTQLVVGGGVLIEFAEAVTLTNVKVTMNADVTMSLGNTGSGIYGAVHQENPNTVAWSLLSGSISPGSPVFPIEANLVPTGGNGAMVKSVWIFMRGAETAAGVPDPNAILTVEVSGTYQDTTPFINVKA